MILIIIKEIYPAAEPDALVGIVRVDLVVLLDVVQKENSVNHHTTRKKRTKRVVVPLADTPKNVIDGIHPNK